MLITLRLKNFAVVEEAEVGFGPGLTVLTGETGAGKSILIDALGLLVGGRAEADVIRSGADEAVDRRALRALRGAGRAAGRAGAARRRPRGERAARLRPAGPRAGARQRRAGDGGRAAAPDEGAGRHRRAARAHGAARRGPAPGLVDRFGELADGARGAAPTARRGSGCARRSRGSQALGGDESQVAGRIDFLTFQLEEIERVSPKPGEDVALEIWSASASALRSGCASGWAAPKSWWPPATARPPSCSAGRCSWWRKGRSSTPRWRTVREALLRAQAELEEGRPRACPAT